MSIILSQQCRDFIGKKIIGKTIAEVLPEVVAQGFLRLLDHVGPALFTPSRSIWDIQDREHSSVFWIEVDDAITEKISLMGRDTRAPPTRRAERRAVVL